jgi:ribonucleoside-diphosphate reductase alpha chain
MLVTDAHIFYSSPIDRNSYTRNIKWKYGELSEVRADNLKIGDTVKYAVMTPTTGEIEYLKDIKILDIETNYSTRTVYDVYCEESDTWITQGIVQRGCGEICMPSHYGQCNLGSMILPTFVTNPFQEDCSFDLKRFSESVQKSIRYLDNVISVSQAPLQESQDVMLDYRRVGLGFSGLGSTFAMLKIGYGSKESLIQSELIGKTLRDSSYTASALLAKEKGPFPKYNREKILQANFIKSLPEEIVDMISTYGLRNIGLNTCAPTGTSSIVFANNCSSGIEPIFALEYNRNVKDDKGNQYNKQKVYDYAWLKYEKYCTDKSIPLSKPDYFTVTGELDPYSGISVQAVFQKYIDHSISRTANLPKGFSYEEYKNIFMYAYDNGLKGFTSFNPGGSLRGVLEDGTVDSTDKVQHIERRQAPARPEDLDCDIHEVNIKGDTYIVLVGKLNGTLYEVFVTKDNDNHLKLDKHTRGIIRKVKSGRYDLIVEDDDTQIVIKNISHKFDGLDGTLSRLVSLGLRHGVPLQFLVDQLKKDSTVLSVGFDISLSRVLKHYIKDGEVAHSGICPACGSKNLVYKDGCKMCIDCGDSRCS